MPNQYERGPGVVAAILKRLSHGGWVNGRWLMKDAGDTVHPGYASRLGMALRKGEAPLDELIAAGRHERTRKAIAELVRRGRLELDTPLPLTKAHWRGDLPWRVRDLEAGWRSVPEAATELGVTEAQLRNWIKQGYVPEPGVRAGGWIGVPPDLMPIYRRVRAAWPGRNRRWAIDPRTVWDEPPPPPDTLLECPHCGKPIQLAIVGNGTRLAKPTDETTYEEAGA